MQTIANSNAYPSIWRKQVVLIRWTGNFRKQCQGSHQSWEFSVSHPSLQGLHGCSLLAHKSSLHAWIEDPLRSNRLLFKSVVEHSPGWRASAALGAGLHTHLSTAKICQLSPTGHLSRIHLVCLVLHCAHSTLRRSTAASLIGKADGRRSAVMLQC